ncbi:hypothetical protein ACFUIW_31685 [Streptomyces sp. NPDC057245]|uniref:hypothetical protein n=1 Tax=Streptomyces TaxID=1883 RepID=UPI001C1E7D4A|nr:hypothetical protein [Streptomyces sp. A108]MBU6534750.1 hypothetical protein [Streptomyces sp. A108]
MTVRARVRSRALLAAVTALAAGAAVAVTTGPAAAAAPRSGPPAFLDPAELPPHASSDWYAGPVTAGQPDPLPLCVGEALPSLTSHRRYWTEMDAGALQVTVVERSTPRARELAALLRADLADCARRIAEQHPDVTATQKDYGSLDVEEGAHVYGVHTVAEWGASDINLLSVGRDDRAVTVVQWGQMGTFEHAQVADFRRTTVTAVDKLY